LLDNLNPAFAFADILRAVGYNANMPSPRKAILAALRERITDLPTGPGVYLFKDDAGVVLYVGKAKTLRSRVASYFQPSADLASTRGPDIARMIEELVTDINILECDSEVDALLRENRLIKDVQPRFNDRQKDDKSFPYLQITSREDFPRVSITRNPESKSVKLFGPFISVYELRQALPLMQRVFKFRTCKLPLKDADDTRRHFRPCILHNIKQCTAPCAARVSKDDYRRQIRDLTTFLNSKGAQLRKQLTTDMDAASKTLDFERAAQLRDELKALESLQKRGLSDEQVQPEVFYVDPMEGLEKLGKVLGLDATPRTIEGIDIAHLGGNEQCGSVVCFIDGKPLKSAYRKFKIRTVAGSDDYAAIREVISRRYRRASDHEELFPDVILIDGGKGQLNAALEAFAELKCQPPALLSLAKKEEALFAPDRDEPLKLSRHDPALRLMQAVRDEAHRFVQHYHHILRRKATLGE
jgi:excinuclease ABC subunit C